MITMSYLLRRSPGLSREEFHRYMSEKHGPLVAGYGSVLRVDRYVQSYTIEDPFNEYMQETRGMMEPFDGVDQFWWENREDLVKALATSEGKQAVQEIVRGEREFVDFSKSSLWFAIVYPQINPAPENGIVARARSPLIKMISFQRPAPGLSDEEGQRYWLMNHASLVRPYIEAVRCLRYIHAHKIEDPIANELRAARGKMDDPYMGQCESWWNRLEMALVMQSPELTKYMQETLFEDEKKYCDHSRSVLMMTKERVFIEK